MSGCYVHHFKYPNLFGIIGILHVPSMLFGTFYSISHQLSYNKILLNAIINLINLSSTSYHYLTIFLMPSVVSGTSVHYHVYYMTLNHIRVHLHSQLLLHG